MEDLGYMTLDHTTPVQLYSPFLSHVFLFPPTAFPFHWRAVTETQQTPQPILSRGLNCTVTHRHRNEGQCLGTCRTLPLINSAVLGLLSDSIIIVCGEHAVIYGLIWIFEPDMESLTVVFRFLYVGFIRGRQRCLTEQCQNPGQGKVNREALIKPCMDLRNKTLGWVLIKLFFQSSSMDFYVVNTGRLH